MCVTYLIPCRGRPGTDWTWKGCGFRYIPNLGTQLRPMLEKFWELAQYSPIKHQKNLKLDHWKKAFQAKSKFAESTDLVRIFIRENTTFIRETTVLIRIYGLYTGHVRSQYVLHTYLSDSGKNIWTEEKTPQKPLDPTAKVTTQFYWLLVKIHPEWIHTTFRPKPFVSCTGTPFLPVFGITRFTLHAKHCTAL